MPESTKPVPAIGFLELSDIAAGIATGDALVKAAPIRMLRAGTVSGGRWLILFGGTVGATETAFRAGLAVAGDACRDHLFLPDIHPAVYHVLSGARTPVEREALAVLDTGAVARAIAAADAGIKGAAVTIPAVGLGAHYDGRGYVLFNGALEDVEAAVAIAAEAVRDDGRWSVRVIPRLDPVTVRQLAGELRFEVAPEHDLPEGERP